jgi:hypothetical protein
MGKPTMATKKIVNRAESLQYPDVVRALYQGILERPVDESGFQSHLDALQNGAPLTNLIRGMIESDEFKIRHPIKTGRGFLPDLTEMYPDKYLRKKDDFSIFEASSDDDFRLMESLIVKHRFYDSNDVYSSGIDLDKQVTGSIVRGLGARTCIEMGCFAGPVLSVLASQGIDVCGIEVSHLAFVLAYNNVRERLRYGDLLDLQFDRTYDVFFGMDVLEHLNPLKLDNYIHRISKLVRAEGFIFINSPMFGHDDVFGTAFEIYVPEWQQAGEDEFWRYLHCDGKGWPVHGHLVLASPRWWERAFLKQGLVRDRDIEKSIHSILKPFFDKIAPARRSFFVLKHSGFEPNSKSVARDLDLAISPLVVNIR